MPILPTPTGASGTGGSGGSGIAEVFDPAQANLQPIPGIWTPAKWGVAYDLLPAETINRVFTGICKPGTLIEGKPLPSLLILRNSSTFAVGREGLIELQNEVGATPAGERIKLTSRENATLKQGETTWLLYTFHSEKWTDIGTAGLISAFQVKSNKEPEPETSGGISVQVLADKGGGVGRVNLWCVIFDGVHSSFIINHKYEKKAVFVWPFPGIQSGTGEGEAAESEVREQALTLAEAHVKKITPVNKNETKVEMLSVLAKETVQWYLTIG